MREALTSEVREALPGRGGVTEPVDELLVALDAVAVAVAVALLLLLLAAVPLLELVAVALEVPLLAAAPLLVAELLPLSEAL